MFEDDPVLEAVFEEIDERLYKLCVLAIENKQKHKGARSNYDEVAIAKVAIDIWLNDLEFLISGGVDESSSKERVARLMQRIRKLSLTLRTLRTLYRNGL